MTFAPERSTAVSEAAACVGSVIIAGCRQQWGTAIIVIIIINCSIRYSE